jgi:hypothetical protein
MKKYWFPIAGFIVAFLASSAIPAYAQKSCTPLSATTQNCIVTLTWQVGGVDATHPAPTSFQLRRGDGGGTKVVIGTVTAPTMLLQNTFTDAGNVAHCWDAIGILGTQSSAASTQACWTSPAIPALVPATPDGFTVSSLSSNAIELSWQPSETAETYAWERRRSNHRWVEKTGTVLADVTSFVNNYLRKGTTYCYDLVAINAFGSSGATPELCATTRW